MKVQLDFTRKEITLESNVNLKEFFDKVKTLLPDWEEWGVTTNSVIYTSSPIPWTWVEPFTPIPWTWVEPFTPYYNPPVTCTTSGPGEATVNMSNHPFPKEQNIYCLDVN